MGPFGERMRREREMRGISLHEISEATKITTRCLRAIEEEKFSRLPGGIFNKGFVRSYARYIGIDEEEAVADFLAASGDVEPPLPTVAEVRGPAPSPALPNGIALATLGVFVLLVFGVVQLYPAAKRLAGRAWADVTRPPTVSANQPSTRSEQAPATPPPAPVNENDVAPAALAVSNEPTVEPTQTPASEPPPPASETPATLPPPATDAAPTTADPPKPAPKREFQVEIRAKKDSWISIVADGKVQKEGMMSAPAERVIRARKRVVLKMGNAAGLELSHNGRVLPPIAGDNQVTTLVFTAEGVQR